MMPEKQLAGNTCPGRPDSSMRTVVLLCALQATAVHASDRSWYGWQTLAIDGTAFATWTVTSLVGKTQARPPVSTVNLAGRGVYLLGAPIVHAVHGKPGAAIGSLALRALPMGV